MPQIIVGSLHFAKLLIYGLFNEVRVGLMEPDVAGVFLGTIVKNPHFFLKLYLCIPECDVMQVKISTLIPFFKNLSPFLLK